jgi:hypothetical protein
VLEINVFKNESIRYPVRVVVEREGDVPYTATATTQGSVLSNSSGSVDDLFMETVVKKGFANLYRQFDGRLYVGNNVADTKALAEKNAELVAAGTNGTRLVKTLEFEYEV